MSDQFSALFVKFNDTSVRAVKRGVAEAEQAVREKQERAQRERVELAEIIEERDEQLRDAKKQMEASQFLFIYAKKLAQAQQIELSTRQARLDSVQKERDALHAELSHVRWQAQKAIEEAAELGGQVKAMQSHTA